ncbi:hypothetical protein ASPZODRAFT_221355 [Penicilliopsis zonata CBS 506.65]|uniref:Uncharacterized protein n=1 Tax=Penicilliopsis zonata CBS 506.65 TaxID=1073090 RepID=A0A1L9SU33_9EURO|nr:hypothetical protein ASPZODRAFT_221355 [Penicilliopsis zonata CBS 506.65]OJJ50634.1 hypothetical protein ASPZODRAFT_221355 [Penicilliopsis zonata CBS 506.65]
MLFSPFSSFFLFCERHKNQDAMKEKILAGLVIFASFFLCNTDFPLLPPFFPLSSCMPCRRDVCFDCIFLFGHHVFAPRSISNESLEKYGADDIDFSSTATS